MSGRGQYAQLPGCAAAMRKRHSIRNSDFGTIHHSCNNVHYIFVFIILVTIEHNKRNIWKLFIIFLDLKLMK